MGGPALSRRPSNSAELTESRVSVHPATASPTTTIRSGLTVYLMSAIYSITEMQGGRLEDRVAAELDGSDAHQRRSDEDEEAGETDVLRERGDDAADLVERALDRGGLSLGGGRGALVGSCTHRAADRRRFQVVDLPAELGHLLVPLLRDSPQREDEADGHADEQEDDADDE